MDKQNDTLHPRASSNDLHEDYYSRHLEDFEGQLTWLELN